MFARSSCARTVPNAQADRRTCVNPVDKPAASIPKDRRPAGTRLFLMWALLLAIPIATVVLLILAYYAIGKLTFSAFYCGSFAKLDAELGWVLRPSATSCLGGRSVFSNGPPWFTSEVYTDADGFRAARPGGDAPSGGILAAGDSFTFGYGVDYGRSYPGTLEQLTGMPVVNLASPAYSSAQALGLAQRWVGRLRPRAIVFLEMGQWARAACSGTSRPRFILKPCYWQPPGSSRAQLVWPRAGQVTGWAKKGVLPGGIIGAGEATWTYFLVSRPAAQIMNALTRAGLTAGFADDYAAVGVDGKVIRAAVVDQLGQVAEAGKVPVILLDPYDTLPDQMLDTLAPGERTWIHRLGSERWREAVTQPARLLPETERSLPHDPHFGPGVNRLIAGMLARELRSLGISADPTHSGALKANSSMHSFHEFRRAGAIRRERCPK